MNPEVEHCRSAQRNQQLDGLRGICAMIVVLYHLLIIPTGLAERLNSWVLPKVVMAGGSAVLVFFALSGFVLYLTFAGRDGFQPIPFIARRLGRLYPPVFAATAIAVLLLALSDIRPLPGTSPWFASLWGSAIDAREIARHCLLVDGDYSFDSPLWSLAVEVQFSMLFPVLAFAIDRKPRSTALAAVGISLVGAALSGRLGLPRALDIASTLQFSALFVLGALLAKNRKAWGEPLAEYSGFRLLALPFAIALTVISPQTGLGAPASLGALALTALVAFSPSWGAILRLRTIQFLGQISFSLYLTHLPVILAVMYLLGGILPIPAILTLVIPITLAVGFASFQLFERPSILLGRWMAERLRSPDRMTFEVLLPSNRNGANAD